MKRYTQRELRAMANDGRAIDITRERRRDRVNEPYNQIGYSAGIYGCNGKLLRGDSGQLYVITKATTSLYMF